MAEDLLDFELLRSRYKVVVDLGNRRHNVNDYDDNYDGDDQVLSMKKMTLMKRNQYRH